MGSVSFKVVAEGGSFKIDPEEVRRAARILFAPGERHEFRALPSARCRQVTGGDEQGIIDAATALCDEAVYYSLNPIGTEAERASKATVTRRKWLPIDIDTCRPKDVSSTEEEKAKSAEIAITVVEYLTNLGWPAPVYLDSGNGWHLLYAIDLPHSDLTTQLVKKATHALADRFDTAFGKIDRATHDAPRVFKLPGTCARKGQDTAERPWRMARLTYDPERIECVTVEQLKALTDEPAKEKGPASFATTASNGGRSLASYVNSAINAEVSRVALAGEGERNTALNRAAFSLGQFASWPEMDKQSAESSLIRAAQRAGLPAAEILQTFKSGWEAGEKLPRDRPADETPQPTIEAVEEDDLIIGLDEIVPETVDWFWEDRIAPGFISLFAGRTGMGKSFVTCDYVAKVSRGEHAPYSELKARPLRTLFISEDPPNIMLGPRLLELNANKSRVKFMKFKAMSIWTLADLDMLERAWMRSGKPEQIVIDPPSNFLGDIDEHKNAALRGLLMPLVAWLEKTRVACVMITHLNKQVGKGIDAVGRIMGSVAWASTARMTLAFDKDPDTRDQNLMGGSKNNLGSLAKTLAFRVVKTQSLARIEWLGLVDINADDMVNQVPKKSKGLNAVEWLEGLFRERREWESEEIKRMSKEFGITKYALFESPEVLALPIDKRKRVNASGESYWVWIARGNWPSESSESSESCNASPSVATHIQDSEDDQRSRKDEINGMFGPLPE